jgi:hypothetical protein
MNPGWLATHTCEPRLGQSLLVVCHANPSPNPSPNPNPNPNPKPNTVSSRRLPRSTATRRPCRWTRAFLRGRPTRTAHLCFGLGLARLTRTPKPDPEPNPYQVRLVQADERADPARRADLQAGDARLTLRLTLRLALALALAPALTLALTLTLTPTLISTPTPTLTPTPTTNPNPNPQPYP